eukprot:scaffold20589_cov83-Skeletonema_dohrnii-CCMP3373.AAC.1
MPVSHKCQNLSRTSEVVESRLVIVQLTLRQIELEITSRVNFAKYHAVWAILHIALWYHTAKPKTHISSKLSEGQYYSFIDSHN